MQISFKPNSPFKNDEQGNIFFWSHIIACAKALTAAPGAYQAEVPNSPVNVAPPTFVSCLTCSNLSAESRPETFSPFLVA
jgi:hypothetical protein